MAQLVLVGMALLGLLFVMCGTGAAQGHGEGKLVVNTPGGLTVNCEGELGERVEANVDNWLLPAIDANPGILEMFRLRDRKPPPDIMPWAGEFIGKYLTNAIQACKMTGRPELRAHIQDTISEFISTQAEDGYMGPWPKGERLLGHWDLWGHYHVMLGLLMWEEYAGDGEALETTIRAADLICDTYLDTDRTPLDAGSDEMNLSIIHSLGILHRRTGDDRYLRMMRVVEKDWESAGDYFRTGVAGVDYYQTPKPRWESLHSLQGLVELYLITGDEDYKKAFSSHWTTIVQHDRHPSGGFSTHEQAIGNPYSEGAIETCCTTAWVAMSVDMLRLTGDSRVADELELSLWNSVLGSQHPSGRWWTYDTPINGVRKASAHHIVFQAREGTPELNCCSVNAPRGIGSLSEWAVTTDAEGAYVNYYGPSLLDFELQDGARVAVEQETEYPAEGAVKLTLRVGEAKRFALRLRVPGWSEQTAARVNGEAAEGVEPGTYLGIDREWSDGDVVELTLDMTTRYWAGELGRRGRAAIYRGPVLLTFDQKFNAMDVADMPALDAQALESEGVEVDARFTPLVAGKFAAADGTEVVLVDFASAGAHGTEYAAWLPVTNAAPAPVWLKRPRDGQAIPSGPASFQWTGYGSGKATGRTYTLEVAKDAGFTEILQRIDGLERATHVLEDGLPEGGPYHWRVTSVNEHGASGSRGGASGFTVDASLENTVGDRLVAYDLGERGLMLASALDGNGEPTIGVLQEVVALEPATDRHGREGGAVQFGGENCGVKYTLPYFPEGDYSFHAWVCPEGLPADGNQQVFSAWALSMDDPLRVCFGGSGVYARIEAHQTVQTESVEVANGEWFHVAAVKEGARLRLYVNGELKSEVAAPEWTSTAAMNVAIGTNPNYHGNECLVGLVDDFAFHAEALTGEELAEVYRAGR